MTGRSNKFLKRPSNFVNVRANNIAPFSLSGISFWQVKKKVKRIFPWNVKKAQPVDFPFQSLNLCSFPRLDYPLLYTGGRYRECCKLYV